MADIRQAEPEDLDALYRVSVKTGNLGEDASHLHGDTRLVGHIYSAPYLMFSPDLAFVAEIRGQVLGFCVGTENTANFEKRLETSWWPDLRKTYPKPNEETWSTWSADEQRCHMIHNPEIVPKQVADRFPAHLHMNLLPELQGQGIGSLLLRTWKQRAAELGVTAAHIGASPRNRRAVGFWRRQGFEKLSESAVFPGSGTVWMGRSIG